MPAWNDKTAGMFADATQIRGFVGDYQWPSNFHPCRVVYRGLGYGSSEEAYQAAKFPEDMRPQFQGIGAYQAKKKATALTKDATAEAKAAWNAAKADVMREVVWCKFSQNPELARRLLATGSAYIEETNWWGDVFFGVCRGKGKNMLGIILMETRGRLGGTGVVMAPATGDGFVQLTLL